VPRPSKVRPPAHWKGNRDLSEEGKRVTATHPSLYMHVWCNFSGVNVIAYVDHLNAKGQLLRTEVAKATWRPPEVSERLVVEWGERALRAWLEGPSEG
jgi:hypothetical protein